jgi:hypothetical protein
MRILHLDAGKEMRGGQWQALRLMEGLAAAGVESTLLARRGGPLFEAARSGAGASSLGPGARHAAGPPARPDARARRAQPHARRHRGSPGGWWSRGAWRSRWAPAWKYRRARRYLAVSEFVKSVLVAGGVPEEKIAVVYDGVPLLEPARGSSVVAPANADDPRKGAPLAVEAASLAGVELKLSTDLERDLRDAAVFVYITHSEGLGSGALLAMSAGVPVVASDVGGLPEIIRHGENGLLVDNTPQAIAAAVRQLLDDPAFARRLGDAARRTVMERFTVDHMVRRTMEVYRQVLS